MGYPSESMNPLWVGYSSIAQTEVKDWLRISYFGLSAKWSNLQGSRTIRRSRKPLENGWLIAQFTRLSDEAMHTRCPAPRAPLMPMSIQPHASYAVSDWFRVSVQPSPLTWLSSTNQPDGGAGHSPSSAHIGGNLSVPRRQCLGLPRQKLFEMHTHLPTFWKAFRTSSLFETWGTSLPPTVSKHSEVTVCLWQNVDKQKSKVTKN